MKNKYKYKYAFLTLALMLNVIISHSETYYWNNGKKIPLEIIDTKKFIIFDLENKDSSDVFAKFSEKSIKIKSIKAKEYSDEKNNKWAIVEKSFLNQLKKDDFNIKYEGSFFYNPNKIEAGLSHIFYVKLRKMEDMESLEILAKDNNVTILRNNKYMPLWFTLACSKESKGNALEMANMFYESKLFASSEPNLMLKDMRSCGNDTYSSYQWAIDNTGQFDGTSGIDIDLCLAHYITMGNSNVVIAVIDDGVYLDHPDINISNISYDTKTLGISQERGNHGTAVAGIIGAKKNNNLGIIGVAPQCKIMSISNVIGENYISNEEIASGIDFACGVGGASVINCSFFSLEFDYIHDAINTALTQGRNGLGCIVVCSAGNNDISEVDYPARSNNDIIVVGAVSPCGERKTPNSCDGEDWGSNYGQQLDIMAPGVLISTTDRQGSIGYNSSDNLHTSSGGSKIQSDFPNMDYTVCFSGTSAAAPHVSGVAALLLSLNPSLKGKYVSTIIERTAQKVGGYDYKLTPGYPNGTWDSQMGYGLLNANLAVREEYNNPTKNIIDTIIEMDIDIPGNNYNYYYIEDVSVTNYSTLSINYGHGFIIDSNFNVELGSKFYTY